MTTSHQITHRDSLKHSSWVGSGDEHCYNSTQQHSLVEFCRAGWCRRAFTSYFTLHRPRKNGSLCHDVGSGSRTTGVEPRESNHGHLNGNACMLWQLTPQLTTLVRLRNAKVLTWKHCKIALTLTRFLPLWYRYIFTCNYIFISYFHLHVINNKINCIFVRFTLLPICVTLTFAP